MVHTKQFVTACFGNSSSVDAHACSSSAVCSHLVVPFAITHSSARADRVSSHGFAAAMGSSSGYAGDMGAAATFAEALAGSMLVRGVLYANAHPAPRRWLPLRKSGWAAAARGAAANAAQLQSLVWAGGGAALHWCAWYSSFLSCCCEE